MMFGLARGRALGPATAPFALACGAGLRAAAYSGMVSETDTRGVTTVTLNKPKVHNAFDAELITALREEFERLATADATRVVVLRGEGKSFSAGADLGYMRSMGAMDEAANVADALELGGMMHALRFLPKPTIASVHGAAFGGGVGLIAACDVAFGTANAKLSLSEVKLGLTPAVISPFVIAAMGERAAARWFISAEVFSGTAAKDTGLLHEVYPTKDELDAATASFVDGILNNGSGAMSAAKDLIHLCRGRPIDEALLHDTAKAIAARRVSDEAQERLSAFLAKAGSK